MVKTNFCVIMGKKELTSDVRQTICSVSPIPYELNGNLSIPVTPYELPDGRVIDIGVERVLIPELMFNPQLSVLSSPTFPFPLLQDHSYPLPSFFPSFFLSLISFQFPCENRNFQLRKE